MKFLCGNCKAKYQIADEKISGRTLRMKCRRCQHDIIIRGEEQAAAAAPAAAASGAARAPAAPRRPGGPAPAPAPRAPQRGSALGADFRRSVGGAAPKPPAPAPPPPPAELWHVAINDVPVGPIRREEVEKKIQTGAVNGESLCWREGFDDWRPLKDVAELASLLRKQRPPPPSRRPPVGKGIGQRRSGESRPRIRPSARPGSESSRPAAPIPDNVVPIGGRLGGSAAPPEVDPYEEEATRVGAPAFQEDDVGPTIPEPSRDLGSLPKAAATLSSVPESSPPAAEPPASDPLADMFGSAPGAAPASPAFGAPAASPSAEVALSEAPPKRRKRAIPIGAWIAIAAAGAFGMTLAVFVATNLMRQPEPVADATAPTTPEPEPTTAEPQLVLEEEPTAETEEEAGAEEEAPEDNGAATSGMRRAAAGMTTSPTTATMRALTAEQQALIERMGGSGSAGANINTDEVGNASMMNNRPQLTENQLRSTVNNNRRSLQRCYELAIRGAGEPPTIRLDVQVTIAESGRVTRVSASGRDFGGMKACVESNVRRWRFPASGGATATAFPVVFQPGA